MKRIIWLFCDLDLRGDYKSLYAWLDEKEARECGDSLAALQSDTLNATTGFAEIEAVIHQSLGSRQVQGLGFY